MERLFVVVSGLPGSGKTVLGRLLAAHLQLVLLDKDDILEALLDSLGAADADQRQRLSRAADAVLQATARRSPGGVLSSFWRRERLSATSGTPWEWLRHLPDARLVEVYCHCPPAIAADRFLARQRHPGHHDARHTREQLAGRFELLAAEGPLGVGSLVMVSTTERPAPHEVIADIERQLGVVRAGCDGSQPPSSGR